MWRVFCIVTLFVCFSSQAAADLFVTTDHVSAGSGTSTRTVGVFAMDDEGVAERWTVDAPSVDWLTISPTSGRDFDFVDVEFKFAGNPGFGNRSTRVMFRSGTERHIIRVTQQPRCREDEIEFQLSAVLPACQAAEVPLTTTSGRAPVLSASDPAAIEDGKLVFTGAGDVTVRATLNRSGGYCPASATTTVRAERCNQTILFDPPSSVPGSALPLEVTAQTERSGLDVDISVVEGPATLTGNLLNFTEPGTALLRAEQPGNAVYNAAPPRDRVVEVALLEQTIKLDVPPSTFFPGGSIELTGSAEGGAEIFFSATGEATLSGNRLTPSAPGQVVVRAFTPPTATHDQGSATATITVLNVDDWDRLRREGFIGNALARSGMREAFLARVVANYWAGGAEEPLPTAHLQSAWDASELPRATELGLKDVDFVHWMAETIARRLDAAAAEAGPDQVALQRLAQDVRSTGRAFRALHRAALAERGDLTTELFGSPILAQLETWAAPLSAGTVEVDLDFERNAFGALFDVGQSNSAFADAFHAGAYAELFDVGVRLDARPDEMVDGLDQAVQLSDPENGLQDVWKLLNIAYATGRFQLEVPQMLQIERLDASARSIVATRPLSLLDGQKLRLEPMTQLAMHNVTGLAVGSIFETKHILELTLDPDDFIFSIPTLQEQAEKARKTLKVTEAAFNATLDALGPSLGLSEKDIKGLKLTVGITIKTAEFFWNTAELVGIFGEKGLGEASYQALTGNFLSSLSALATIALDMQTNEEMIIEALETISRQISDLRLYAGARFDGLDDRMIDAIGKLNEVLRNQQRTAADLAALEASLSALRQDFARFEAGVYRRFAEQARVPLIDTVAEVIDAPAGSVGADMFEDAMRVFFVHGTTTARGDRLMREDECSLTGCRVLVEGVHYASLPFFNALPTLLSGGALAPHANPQALSNLAEWSLAAGAMATLATQQAQHRGTIDREMVQAMIRTGEVGVDTLRQMTLRPNGEALEVFTLLLDDIATAKGAVRAELAKLHRQAVEGRELAEIITSRTPWPVNLHSDPDSIRPSVYTNRAVSWAQSGSWTGSAATYFTKDELPAPLVRDTRLLAMLAFLHARSESHSDDVQTILNPEGQSGARDYFDSRVTHRERRFREDLQIDGCSALRAELVGVRWEFTTGDETLIAVDLIHDELHCPPAPSAAALLESDGLSSFGASVASGTGPLGLAGMEQRLRSAISTQALEIVTETRDLIDEAVRDDASRLGLAIQNLKGRHEVLSAYIELALPASSRSNEVLLRFRGGELLHIAADPKSAIAALYGLSGPPPDYDGKQPFELFEDEADIVLMKATLENLIDEIEATDISEPEILFARRLKELRVLLPPS